MAFPEPPQSSTSRRRSGSTVTKLARCGDGSFQAAVVCENAGAVIEATKIRPAKIALGGGAVRRNSVSWMIMGFSFVRCSRHGKFYIVHRLVEAHLVEMHFLSRSTREGSRRIHGDLYAVDLAIVFEIEGLRDR